MLKKWKAAANNEKYTGHLIKDLYKGFICISHENHFTKLRTDDFDSMLLSCHVRVSEWIYTL